LNGKSERFLRSLSATAGFVAKYIGVFAVLALIAGTLLVLVNGSWLSIQQNGLSFFTGTDWAPNMDKYGGLTIIYGTLVSTLIAMIIAVPLSLVIALFLVELAHPVVSRIFGTAIELLAAIPSIIFGMWGFFVLMPLMQNHVQPLLQTIFGKEFFLFAGPPRGSGLLTAGIILSIMILPFISAVARDVMTMVPPVVKESAYGVGATSWEVTRGVSFRYGLQGLIGGAFLGLGRALGETMAVAYVIGSSPRFSASITQPSYSIPSAIANQFGEAEPLHKSALVELALVLFAITCCIQIAYFLWMRRMKRSVGVL